METNDLELRAAMELLTDLLKDAPFVSAAPDGMSYPMFRGVDAMRKARRERQPVRFCTPEGILMCAIPETGQQVRVPALA